MWLALGGNVVFLAVAAFLGRSLIGQWFAKELERHKQQLAGETAHHLKMSEQRMLSSLKKHAINSRRCFGRPPNCTIRSLMYWRRRGVH
ncbi:MAG: hypothetical protein JWN63_1270 [Candidatus Acidoferrum typicum]|nr:hypothetical protein [Candidatus Acidoferrum typicum]